MITEHMSKKQIQQVVAALREDPDAAIDLLKEGAGALPQGNGDSDTGPSIPDDDLTRGIDYIKYLRRLLKNRRPDPFVLAAIRTIMEKWGYQILAKTVAKLGRKMGFRLKSDEVKKIVASYGKVVEPLLAILLMDILERYYDITRKDPTRSQFD